MTEDSNTFSVPRAGVPPHRLVLSSGEGDGAAVQASLECPFAPEDPKRPCVGVDCPLHEDDATAGCLGGCIGAVQVPGCAYAEYLDAGCAEIGGLEITVAVTGCWDGETCVLVPAGDPRDDVVAAALGLSSSAEECDGWDELQSALKRLGGSS